MWRLHTWKALTLIVLLCSRCVGLFSLSFDKLATRVLILRVAQWTFTNGDQANHRKICLVYGAIITDVCSHKSFRR